MRQHDYAYSMGSLKHMPSFLDDLQGGICQRWVELFKIWWVIIFWSDGGLMPEYWWSSKLTHVFRVEFMYIKGGA